MNIKKYARSYGKVLKFSAEAWGHFENILNQNVQHRRGGLGADHNLRGAAADAYEEHTGDTSGANLLRDPNQHVVIRGGKVVPGAFDIGSVYPAHQKALEVLRDVTEGRWTPNYADAHYEPGQTSWQHVNLVDGSNHNQPYPDFEGERWWEDLDPKTRDVHLGDLGNLFADDIEHHYSTYGVPHRKTPLHDSMVADAVRTLRNYPTDGPVEEVDHRRRGR